MKYYKYKCYTEISVKCIKNRFKNLKCLLIFSNFKKYYWNLHKILYFIVVIILILKNQI